MNEPLALVGKAVVGWNSVEDRVSRLTWLYLNTDEQTFEIITDGMRPVDCEKMLKSLVEIKEPNTEVRAEVIFMLTCCKILRENRNIIIHFVTHIDFSDKSQYLVIEKYNNQIEIFINYLDKLKEQVIIQINDRNDRVIYEDEYSDSYEVSPFPTFKPIDRPEKPVKINKENLK